MTKVYLPDFEQLAVTMGQTVGYQISKHNIPDVWLETEGEGVTVAVLDTGCWPHPDLQGALISGHNFWDNSSITKDGGCGHGTHCCGILGARNNTIGIVGVAPQVKILVVKVLSDEGWGYSDQVNAGIYYAINHGADVISMSLGSPDYDPDEHKAIAAAYKANIPVVCAAGNSGDVGSLDYPARHAETISVGALNEANARAEFSQTGRRLDFMAPGVAIQSTFLKDSYTVMSGTSMATPWVAGVVALMISKHRKYGGDTPLNTVEDIREHLRKTCIDLNTAGHDSMTGYGLVDVKAAMAAILIGDNGGSGEKKVDLGPILNHVKEIQNDVVALRSACSSMEQKILSLESELNSL